MCAAAPWNAALRITQYFSGSRSWLVAVQLLLIAAAALSKLKYEFSSVHNGPLDAARKIKQKIPSLLCSSAGDV